MTSSESAIIRLNSVSIAYERTGRGPLIVCIGGIDMDFSMWRRTYLDTLNSSGYSTLTLALRGIPPSTTPPPPYSVEDLVNDCEEVLSILGVGRYFLLGVSLGALVAQELALLKPLDVLGLVLVGTVLRQTAWARMSMQAELELYEAATDLPVNYVVATDILQSFSAEELSDDKLVNRIACGMKLKDHKSPGRRGLLAAVAGYSGCVDRLEKMTTPALMISFEFDVLTPAKVTREACQASANVSFMQIPSTGHAGIFTKRREVAKEVVSFFGAIGLHS